MRANAPLGIVAERAAKTAAVLAANPHLRARIRGWRPSGIVARSHEITVDLRTGQRTVREMTPPPAAPKQKPRIWRMPRPAQKRLRRDKPDDRPRFLAIVKAVCTAWDIEEEGLLHPSRYRRIAHARFAAYRLIRDRIGWSTTQIADVFRVDHTSCLWGLRQATALLAGSVVCRRPRKRACRNEATTVDDWRRRYAAAVAELDGSAP